MCGYRTPKNKEGTIEWPIYKIKRRLMLKKIIRIKQNKSLQFETFNKNFRWACRWSKLLYAFRSNQHFSFVIVWDKNMVIERGISDVKALTSSIFHNPKHIYLSIYIYIYIYIFLLYLDRMFYLISPSMSNTLRCVTFWQNE